MGRGGGRGGEVSCFHGPCCKNTAHETIQNSTMTVITLGSHMVKSKPLPFFSRLCKVVSQMQVIHLDWPFASIYSGGSPGGQQGRGHAWDCPDHKRQGGSVPIWVQSPDSPALRAITRPAAEVTSVTSPRSCVPLPDPLRGEGTMLTRWLQATTPSLSATSLPSRAFVRSRGRQ